MGNKVPFKNVLAQYEDIFSDYESLFKYEYSVKYRAIVDDSSIDDVVILDDDGLLNGINKIENESNKKHILEIYNYLNNFVFEQANDEYEKRDLDYDGPDSDYDI